MNIETYCRICQCAEEWRRMGSPQGHRFVSIKSRRVDVVVKLEESDGTNTQETTIAFSEYTPSTITSDEIRARFVRPFGTY